MNGSLLQAVALCANGNAFLRSAPETRIPEMLGKHKTFDTVHAVEFVRMANRGEARIADCTTAWFRRLQQEGVEELKLSFTDGVGVIAEGEWGSEVWSPQWRARLRGYDDPQPNFVKYTGEKMRRGLVPPILPVAPEEYAAILRNAVDCPSLSGTLTVELVQCLKWHLFQRDEPPVTNEFLPSQSGPNAQLLLTSALRLIKLLESKPWQEGSNDATQPITESLRKLVYRALASATVIDASAAQSLAA